ncbi:hypothetical protein [Butyrivibrio sp.]|uniref:hypothetical protein n=1 Tax=Butyrivibrio sp. TaxID=28121 RepID=UPI0025C54B8B|nr:hypothetical protein [Butyrivibrio sp.]MBQ9303465.1 hypothetical protein [Butyrivibrio sp.]
MKITDVEKYKLRNRIPQNITDEVSAREVAKDIMANDITYTDMSEVVYNCVKYLLIGGLIELSARPANERTLGQLFDWMRQQTLSHSQVESEKYFNMIDMVPEQERNLARFYICDKLIKYQIFNQCIA